jgi:hypothetical protein
MKPTRPLSLLALIIVILVGCTTRPSPTSVPGVTPALDTPTPSIATSTPTVDADAVSMITSSTPTNEPTETAPPTPSPPPSPTPTPPPTATAEPTPLPPDLFDSISQQHLFAFIADLTAIQPYSGWRSSATQGEAEALDYVAETLDGFAYLQELGVSLERQSFRVFNSTELWETRLHLTLEEEEVEVPADGLRGDRNDIALALRSDSDGLLNDATRDPVIVQGPVELIRSSAEIFRHSPADLQGKVLFLDYAALDRILVGDWQQVATITTELLALQPAGLVLVTQFSNQPGESHGAFVGDGSPLTWAEADPGIAIPPTLYVRLEDLAPAGVQSWEDLAKATTARLTWDADVFAPGTSENLIARLPGADTSRAVILGAHIDSPNSPGALDDGSGSAILLEVARVLDAARVQPPVDLYLAWFGSEEIGGDGSAYFAATHQELLDHTLAMLQIDCLTRPLDGIRADLTLTTWSYGRLGDDRLTWPDYLTQVAERRGVETVPTNAYAVQSDNSMFAGFDVPNANLIYEGPMMDRYGPIHYAAHLHDPYETVELAREMGDVLEQMTRVALAAALETGRDAPSLRVAPPADGRVLFVASHTEALLMSPIGFTDLGQTLAMAGFDVDLIPYGQAVTPADLEDAALVVVLPVLDYPSQAGDLSLYDEAWSEQEIETLEAYVANGGLLVLTNSAHRLKFSNSMIDYNEDWQSLNPLAERFGISYRFGTVYEKIFWAEKNSHPLVERMSYLELLPGNSVPLKLQQGQVLAWADGRIVIGLVDHGDAGGQVLALADVGLLGNDAGTPQSLRFWQNLAQYARSRFAGTGGQNE